VSIAIANRSCANSGVESTASVNKGPTVFCLNFDKFRQLFIIFGTNHPDNPCDWKIVNVISILARHYVINVRNFDVIREFAYIFEFVRVMSKVLSVPFLPGHGVFWPLMGGLLHLVQRGGDWAGPQPARASPPCTKCNSPPIKSQCTNYRIAVYNGPLLCGFNVLIKGLKHCWN